MGDATGPFQRADRLLRPPEFQRVSRRGRRQVVPGFVLVAAPSDGPRVRLGLAVSRRVGGAVVRNRVKRRVREWFRREREIFAEGTDLVVIGRAPAAGLTTTETWRQLGQAARRLGASQP